MAQHRPDLNSPVCVGVCGGGRVLRNAATLRHLNSFSIVLVCDQCLNCLAVLCYSWVSLVVKRQTSPCCCFVHLGGVGSLWTNELILVEKFMLEGSIKSWQVAPRTVHLHFLKSEPHQRCYAKFCICARICISFSFQIFQLIHFRS